MRATTAAHSSRSPRYLGNTRPRLGAPTWWPARPMRCRPRGHAARALHLDHQVDRAHVDAELQAAGGHQARAARPALSSSSIRVRCSRARLPWWARATSSSASSLSRSASRSARRRLLTKIERGAVGPDQLQQLGVHRRPDRAAAALAARHLDGSSLLGAAAGRARACPPPARRPQVELLGARRRPRSSPGAGGPRRPGRPGSARSRPAAAGWPTGRCAGGSPPASATRRSRRSRIRARCAPRLVPATAWISSTITAPDAGEHLPPARGEQQVQALGRGDEDVRRGAQHALRGRAAGVSPGAHRHGHLGRLQAPQRGGRGDAGQRAAQVALDVVVQGLQGREVEQPRAAAGRPAGRPRSRSGPTGTPRASSRSRSAPG